jgi:hypothetical protein
MNHAVSISFMAAAGCSDQLPVLPESLVIENFSRSTSAKES